VADNLASTFGFRKGHFRAAKSLMSHRIRILFLMVFAGWCWVAMLGVHELGHVLAAWGTGGTVVRVVWHPLAISRTDVNPNPHPAIVVWSGPLLGSLTPLLLWWLVRRFESVTRLLAQLFAGFCLIANGIYIGVGSLDAVGDAGVMLATGAPPLALWIFGGIATGSGLLLWHRLGPSFGLGQLNDRTVRIATLIASALLLATLLCQLLWFERW
jgi:hypothetical protein